MPLGFSATINEAQLDDFVLAVRRKTSRDLTDIATPEHVIFKKMEQAGAIREENPGHGPVEDVQYETPRRTIVISRSKPWDERSEEPIQGMTQAQFQWLQFITTLTIPKYVYDNTMGADAMVNYVDRQQKQLDIDLENMMVEVLWQGLTSGTDVCWGLQDMIQFDPSADPAKGAVGGISATNIASWANISKNYNTAFQTWDTGSPVNDFLTNGSNSLLGLYLACTNNPQSMAKAGQPNLIPCNQTMFLYFAELHRQGLVFPDHKENEMMAVDGFRFRGAFVFHDRDCPDDPNNASYGVAYMLNTWSLNFVWARGLKKKWSDKHRLERKTGYQWEETSQGTMTVRDRRRNGVMYGVKPKSVS